MTRLFDEDHAPRTCIVDEALKCPPTSRYDCDRTKQGLCPYVGWDDRLERDIFIERCREVEEEIRKGIKEKEGE